MERIRTRLLGLKARLLETLNAREAAISKSAALVLEEEASFKTSCEQLAKKLEQEQRGLEAAAQQKRQQAEERWKHRTTKVKETCVRIKARFQSQLAARTASWQTKQRLAHEQADQERQQKMDVLNRECTQVLERLAAFEAAAEEQKRRIEDYAEEHRVALDTERFKESVEHIPAENEAVAREITERLGEMTAFLDASGRGFRKRIPSLFWYALVLLAHAGTACYFWVTAAESWHYLPLPATLLIFWAVVYGVYVRARDKVEAAAVHLSRSVNTIRLLIERQRQVMNAWLEQATSGVDAERAQSVAGVDADVERQTKENNRTAGELSVKLNTIRDRMISRITHERDFELADLDQEAKDNAASLRTGHEEALAQRRQQNAARKREIENEKNNEHGRLAAQWSGIVGDFGIAAKEEMAQARKVHPPWGLLPKQGWPLPAEFREEIYIGDVNVNLKGLVPEADAEGKFSIAPEQTLALPLVLTFPLEGSLCIRAGLGRREEGMRTLFNTVLRLLCSLPPAKAKLTIIDPVGLGQNFAALMHLADYDESLVGGRIWCEGSHIERRLTELTEHLEKVIQKYLRNRYTTIGEYNKEAGQLAEPYRFLVIADFPTGFSDIALERLASIITSGVRCGVYTLILHDNRQRLPASLDDRMFRKNGFLIDESEEGLGLVEESLNNGRFFNEEPPSSAAVDTLVNGIGKQCRDSMRVQVPFEAAAPKGDEYWSMSSEAGVRLPLGKAGADRLQYLELGKGTAQHALIAGKTGSGKSNLFHIIITNASLWYNPDEVEFYLIDFKKGVEFKVYGVHRLPHARVVAIESDREFGLSVLRRIDKELTERGELFRKARVQDFPSYRKSNPGTRLPRTILVIDEFQEFFTDEDSVSGEAALLLDRVVRQGRAFGIHVVLGTQTLGGTYSLAKSTLGQVAVRIALQCNEADSYLVLSDDNAAASLLSRPGEAIYNDMSGLVEGNNPFQAVYFPQAAMEPYLRKLQQRAANAGVRLADSMVVFEGNDFADLRNNQMLKSQAAQPPQGVESTPIVWLGEANAIKGPTEAKFIRRAGSNLLIIGERGNAQIATCCTTVLCLAAANSPESIRIHVLDGTNPDSGARQRLAALAEALPYEIKVVEYRDVPQAIAELTATLKARQEGGEQLSCQHYLLVLDLERFRMLRESDEFSLPSEGAASPAEGFANLLAEGPNVDMHSIIWCDKLTNLNRTISRKTLREFEMRILYQMSANDSAELIDSPAANRLGLYNALLFTMQNGAIEKFRPYAGPSTELLGEIGRSLHARLSPISQPTK